MTEIASQFRKRQSGRNRTLEEYRTHHTIFLSTVDQNMNPELETHPVLDNLSAHKHEKVKR